MICAAKDFGSGAIAMTGTWLTANLVGAASGTPTFTFK
tara:strand:+ start:1095 stop:1208 length:114 start_codon:yes stop_codon:yes gene_type:complete